MRASIFSVMTGLANEVGAINLSQGFPDFDCAPALVERVAHYMRAGVNQYAPMAGMPALREAIAGKIARVYGRERDPGTEIVVTCGATEGLFASIAGLVTPGDDVLVFEPAYDSYAPAIRLRGGRPIFVRLQPPSYAIDWDDVRRAMTARTRVVVMNTPHNPTGTIWTAADLDALAALLDGTDAVVVSDEVYEHIVFDGAAHESVHRRAALADRAIVVSSFGKTYHATGWKIGYCSGPRVLVERVLDVHQWITYAVNGAVQLAYADTVREDPACAALGEFYQQKRDRFLDLIAGSRFRPLVTRGTYFQLLDYSAISDESDAAFAVRLTREHGVAAIPISPFLDADGPGSADLTAGRLLRFCFAKKDATLDRAAERLRTV